MESVARKILVVTITFTIHTSSKTIMGIYGSQRGIKGYINMRAKISPIIRFSSKYTYPKILNECLFWTIDGIRNGNKYPSLEPCLIDTTTYSPITGYTRVPGEKLIEISDWYINWHNDYRKNPTDALLKKRLFENTPYKWNR